MHTNHLSIAAFGAPIDQHLPAVPIGACDPVDGQLQFWLEFDLATEDLFPEHPQPFIAYILLAWRCLGCIVLMSTAALMILVLAVFESVQWAPLCLLRLQRLTAHLKLTRFARTEIAVLAAKYIRQKIC